MNRWDAALRPQKARARNDIFAGVIPRKAGIFLPAADCHCVKLALDLGVIHPTRTQVIAVENVPAIVPAMRQTLGAIGLQKVTVHPDWLHTLLLSSHIDFAFLDFLGAITYQTACWMVNELSPKLAAGAEIAMTLAMVYRGNRFMPHLRDVLLGEHEPRCVALAKELRCYNYEVVPIIALFKMLFREWNFDVTLRQPYSDSNFNMMAFRLSNFMPCEPTWPTLGEVVTWDDLARSPYRMSRVERESRRVPVAMRTDDYRQRWLRAQTLMRCKLLTAHLCAMGLTISRNERRWIISVAATGAELRSFSNFNEVNRTFIGH